MEVVTVEMMTLYCCVVSFLVQSGGARLYRWR